MDFAGSWKTAAALGLCFIAGCANYVKSIDKSEKPTEKDAYLYGRFQMSAPDSWLAMDRHQSMGFVVKCADEQSYTIRFDKKEPLQVIKIGPASCGVSEVVYTDADGRVRSRKPAPAALQRPVAFEAGKAYYLGDFKAEASNWTSGTTIHTEWRVTSVRNDYRTTTEQMKSDFPNLSGVATENRMLGR